MFFVCVRMVLSDTVSSRAISGPLSSAAQQPEDLELTAAQLLHEGRTGRLDLGQVGGAGGVVARREEPACLLDGRAVPYGGLQEGAHPRSLVEEDPHVPLRLGSRQRGLQCGERARCVAGGVMRQRQEDEDLDRRAASLPFLHAPAQPVEQCRARHAERDRRGR